MKLRSVCLLVTLLAAVALPSCETLPQERAVALSMLNSSRAREGAPPLVGNSSLDRTTEAWARTLRDRWAAAGCPAAAGSFLAHSSLVRFHAPSRALPGWSRLTENVGFATRGDGRTRDAAQLKVHGTYLASPEHRANIVDRRVSQVGIAVVWGPTEDQRAQSTSCARLPAGSYLWSAQAFIG